jgi:hypothetical protein
VSFFDEGVHQVYFVLGVNIGCDCPFKDNSTQAEESVQDAQVDGCNGKVKERGAAVLLPGMDLLVSLRVF